MTRVSGRRDWLIPSLLVVGVSTSIAVIGARPYAGGWNDGSRLATVESLVDRRTFAIDESIFVTPSLADPSAPTPYRTGDLLLERGTQDRLLIDGRYYSDKSPLPAVLLAGAYAPLQRVTGLTARSRPDLFVYVLTLLWSGLGYVIAVTGMFALAHRISGSGKQALAIAASMGLSTTALTYSRQVNNHLPLLAVVTLLLLVAQVTAAAPREGSRGPFWIGALAGLGYAIDLGMGPVLVATSLALVLHRGPFGRSLVLFLAGCLPWMLLHHALNFHIGGTIRPANSVAAYFEWPGSPFGEATMTGRWNHDHVGDFVVYAGELLVGRKGFLFHNLPVLLACVAWPLLAGRGSTIRERPEVCFAGALAVGTWAIYAALTVNLSGVCASIRWFVPLLAPGFFVASVYLRERPERWPLFLGLSMTGAIVAGLLWWSGPWFGRMVPLYWLWVVVAAALIVRAFRQSAER